MKRLALMAALLALPLAGSARAQDFVPPDLTRYMGTWLWIESQGVVATSTPDVKGASRTLFLHPDLTYEFHQRTGTRDSTLCKGIFSVGESSERDDDEVWTTLDFDGWHEPYEKRMVVNFDGPDTLVLAAACPSCPQHIFLRGQSTLFSAEVKLGQPYRRDLWDGLVFELRSRAEGWEMAIVDSVHPGENRVEITTSAASGTDPRILDGAHLRDVKTRRFRFSREPAPKDTTQDEEDRDPPPGRGVLTVERVKLAPARGGKQGAIESMQFRILIEEARGRGASGKKEARP